MKAPQRHPMIQPLEDRHRDYLKDESRQSGTAESISFPESEADVRAIVTILAKHKTPITVQGSRTGITGGAVPTGGHVMNLSPMNRVLGLEQDARGWFAIRVQPGITLAELDRQLEARSFESDDWDQASRRALDTLRQQRRHFWPPDPSERTATVGGVAANNSRGIQARQYGPTRGHILGLRGVVGHGEVWPVPRGRYLYRPREGYFPAPGGRKIRVAPALLGTPPPGCQDWDLMDLFLGGEGMLGAITELTLALQPVPREVLGIVFFFDEPSGAVGFIEVAGQGTPAEPGARIAAVEFMDRTTLACIRHQQQTSLGMGDIPPWDARFGCAVCLIIHADRQGASEALAGWLLDQAVEHGSDPDASWALEGESEMERLHRFRHAAPESVYHRVDQARQQDPRVALIALDLRFPRGAFLRVLEMFAEDLEGRGLEAAVFGHGADRHLHVNILPRNGGELERGKALAETWAKTIIALGGAVVTDHGVGKTIKHLLRVIPLPKSIEILLRVKAQLDPGGLWNPGNMASSQG